MPYGHRCFTLTLMALASLAAAWFSGCDGTSAQADKNLVVEPTGAVLMEAGESVVLKVTIPDSDANTAFVTNSTIFYPLSWSVTDESLGQILDARGDSAVYVSKGGVGNNAVVVRDQGAREGLVGIRQIRVEPPVVQTTVVQAPTPTVAPTPAPTVTPTVTPTPTPAVVP